MAKGFEKIKSNSFLYDKELMGVAPGQKRWFRRDGTYLTKYGRWTRGSLSATLYYTLYNNLVRVHRIIAFCFVFNPCPGLFDIVDHIDGDTKNNHYTNLRWVDQQLNAMWRHTVEPRYVKVQRKSPHGKMYIYWKWLARTRFEGVEVAKMFNSKKKANAYLKAFRLSEFKRIYQRKVTEYEAEEKRRTGYFY